MRLPRMFLALLTAMLVLAPPHAGATEIRLEPIKISAHTYYFRGQAGMASAENKGFMSNAGFVVTRNGVVVFDALATPVLGQAMVDAIRRITPQPIRKVIVSHYHADHFYGLQALKAQGAEVWAHARGRDVLNSQEVRDRLAQRKLALAPWVNDDTRLVGADRWLTFESGKTTRFEMGGLHFHVIDTSGTHATDDIMLAVEEDKVLFAGDLFFTGRIPFVGNADSRKWLEALDRMLDLDPAMVVPGHGEASGKPVEDMRLTREYLLYLRKKMGAAVQDMQSFDEAYAQVDWSPFENYPAFQQANRLNAYGTYLLMERESLGKQ